MRGGAQSSLIQAEDGNFYIVKLLGNPQGSEVLFNEALGTELIRLVGLPVSAWRAIIISNEFIDRNPALWFETAGSRLEPPLAGLCFGSRLVPANGKETLYELLPNDWFKLIGNRDDFIGMLLFDLWAHQTDNRQAVFVQDLQTRCMRATFIDQGDLFGRNARHQIHQCMNASFIDRRVYTNLDISSVMPKWENRLRAITSDVLHSLVSASSIPAEWYDLGKLDRIIAGLVERLSYINEYIFNIKAFVADIERHEGNCEDLRIHGDEIRSDALGRARGRVSYPC